jgi:hypothetical protein
VSGQGRAVRGQQIERGGVRNRQIGMREKQARNSEMRKARVRWWWERQKDGGWGDRVGNGMRDRREH